MTFLPRSTIWTLEAEEDNNRRLLESIYRIYCIDRLPGGVPFMGVPSTGFLLSSGLIITAGHVVRGRTPPEVVALSIYDRRVEFIDILESELGGPDVAALRPLKAIGGGLELSDDDRLHVGEQVSTLGFPYLGTGSERTAPLLSVGFISGYDDHPDDIGPIKYYIVNGGITIGNSGSPLLKPGDKKVYGMAITKFAPFSSDMTPGLTSRDPELVTGIFDAYNVLSPGMMYRAVCASEIESFLSKKIRENRQ